MTTGMLRLAVKALETSTANGDFEAILSVEVRDRDGETVKAHALDPLPASIPIYYNHDWRTGALPVAKAKPYYDDRGVLKATGTYASTGRGQEMRALVSEGIVDSMSVGFIKGQAKGGTITKGELIEASFTGIPINTSARVLASKALTDLDPAPGFNPVTKVMDGSYEDLTEDLGESLRAIHGAWVTVRGTFPDHVVFDVWDDATGDMATWSAPFTASPDSDDTFTFGTAEEVDVEEVVVSNSKALVPPADDPAAATLAAAGASADDEGPSLLARSLEHLAAI